MSLFKKCSFLSTLSLILHLPLAHSVFVELAIDPKNPSTLYTIELPLPYHPVQPHENFTMVAEGGSFLLTPDSKENYMILGPLNPCIGIIFKNESNGFQLGFHHHLANSFQSLQNIFEQVFGTEDPSQIKVQIYTNQSIPAVYQIFETTIGVQPQSKELKDISLFIQKKLKIPSNNINSLLVESKYTDFQLGRYEFAELYLLIDKAGDIFNTCPLAEDLMQLKGTQISLLTLLPNPEHRKTFNNLLKSNPTRKEIHLPGIDGTPYPLSYTKTGNVNFDDLAINHQSTLVTAAIRRNADQKTIKIYPEVDPYETLRPSDYRKIPFYFENKLDEKASQTPSCAHCGQEGKLRCSQCKTRFYCDATCQKTNWPHHKKTCKKSSVPI